MDKKRFWPFLLVLPLLTAAVAGWFLLPDQLVMRIGVDGQPGNVMPKLFGLLIPGAVGAGTASSAEREKHLAGFLVLAVAAIITGFTFFMNL